MITKSDYPVKLILARMSDTRKVEKELTAAHVGGNQKTTLKFIFLSSSVTRLGEFSPFGRIFSFFGRIIPSMGAFFCLWPHFFLKNIARMILAHFFKKIAHN
jgi:hypothetical protein